MRMQANATLQHSSTKKLKLIGVSARGAGRRKTDDLRRATLNRGNGDPSFGRPENTGRIRAGRTAALVALEGDRWFME